MAGADPQTAARALQRIRRDPVLFCTGVLGFEPWSKQREILESVRDNPRTAVRSCHGVGKTAIAGRVALWFLAAFAPEALVVTTAPTWRQVKDLLWREIARGYKEADGFFDGDLTDTRLEFAPEWYAVGLSTREPENFQGYHSRHLLFIVDEASGVRQPIFEAAEGFLTAASSRTLLIGNPTQVGGEFHGAFHGARSLYNTIHISAFDAPAFTGEPVSERVAAVLPTPEWVAYMRAKYKVPDELERGRPDAPGSSGAAPDAPEAPTKLNPVYQVRVLGQFPDQSDKAVVSMAEVEAAQWRELPEEERDWPRVVACDPARFGADETVIALRRGNEARIVDVAVGQDTMRTAGEILRVATDAISPVFGKPVIVVDEIGIGSGIVDRLREVGGFNVIAYNASSSPAEHNQGVGGYPNARSELWFEFGKEVLPELDLDEDEQLLSDLCAPEYTIDSQGRLVVEPKEKTKERLGRSPDRADAVMMLFSRVANSAVGSVVPFGISQPGGSKWKS